MNALSAPDFVRDHWLPRVPAMLRGAVADQPLRGLTAQDVFARCAPPVFADINLSAPAAPDPAENVRRRVPKIEHLPLLYQRYRGQHRNLICYVFGLDAVDPRFAALRDATLRPFAFRYLSLLASLSDRDSSIELHADLIDTFIVQLSGRRSWRVDEPCSDPAYLMYLHDRAGTKPRLLPKQRPVLDVVLEAGDALYIPATWPHGATTGRLDTESVSVSIGFVAVTVLRVLRLLDGLDGTALLESEPESLLALLPDPAPGQDPARFLAEATRERLSPRARGHLDVDRLAARLAALDPIALAGLNFPSNMSRGT